MGWVGISFLLRQFGLSLWSAGSSVCGWMVQEVPSWGVLFDHMFFPISRLTGFCIVWFKEHEEKVTSNVDVVLIPFDQFTNVPSTKVSHMAEPKFKGTKIDSLSCCKELQRRHISQECAYKMRRVNIVKQLSFY